MNIGFEATNARAFALELRAHRAVIAVGMAAPA
jgi:hypothetical protein